MSIAELRQEYSRRELRMDDVEDDPIVQFQQWFEEALEADLDEPNAMTLSTATPDGQPSARIVLLKGVDERGFAFYTNYRSQKGRELGQNPQAALTFLWKPIERQVRIEGTAHRMPDEESDAYFRSRPRGSQLGAWTSPQSQIVDGREELEHRMEAVKTEYEGEDDVPRPPHWGGFRLKPQRIEFWQGRPNRLHDRIRYRYLGSDWTRERLAP